MSERSSVAEDVIMEPIEPTRAPSIASAAAFIGVGNIASRLLGLVRLSTIAFFFGRGTAVDAYTAAWTIPNTIYDLLINGTVSAALVPVFSEHAEGERARFERLISNVATLILLVLGLMIALLIWQVPLVVSLLVQDTRPAFRAQVIDLARWLLPTIWFMGIAGLFTAISHARRSFLLPAFTGAVFNAGIILGTALLHQQFGITALAIGTMIGAVGQIIWQAPALRDLRYRPMLDLNDPTVRRIIKLYAPVALGIGFSVVGTLIDRWLASGYESGLATMQYATTLIQFPLGLVASAVSLAVLPTLSRQSAAKDEDGFRHTLALGLKIVLFLILPATAGLAALAAPMVALLFERGAFAAQDTPIVALALLLYLPGMPAAAIDQVLVFAFYGRKNTLTPNLVQGAAIALYLLSALPLIWFTSLGFLALVIANTVQWIGHMLIMLVLIRRVMILSGVRLGEAIWKCSLAALLAAGTIFLMDSGLQMLHAIVRLVVAGGLGAVVYIGLAMLLRVEATTAILRTIQERVRRNPPTT